MKRVRWVGRVFAKTPPTGLRTSRPPSYFFADPIRLLCIVCTLFLMFLSTVPAWLVILTVAVSQFNGLVMLARLLARPRHPTGPRGRKWRVQYLGTESFTLSACTLLGGLLFMRIFGPVEPTFALGALTLAVVLLPDVRLCRSVVPRNPFRANQILQDGSFVRDPVKLGAILSAVIICLLDPDSLVFVLASMLLLQFNSLMILIDKHAGLVSWWKRGRGISITRDAWRVLIAVLPFGLLPIRMLFGDTAGWWAAGAITAVVVLPDLAGFLRLVFLAFLAESTEVSKGARKRLAEVLLEVVGIIAALPGLLGIAVGGVWNACSGVLLGRKTRPHPTP